MSKSENKTYSKEREKNYPLSTQIAKMGDSAVEDIVNFPKYANDPRSSVQEATSGIGRYALGAGLYVPAVAVDAVTKVFKKNDSLEPVKKAKGGKVSSASKRADGIAIRGKTKA